MVRILIRLIYQFPINCQKKIKKTKQFLLPIKILGKQYSIIRLKFFKVNAIRIYAQYRMNIQNDSFFLPLKYWCWTNTRSHFNFLSKPYTQLFSHRFHFGDIFSFIICLFLIYIYSLFVFFLLENKFYARKE